ncbi:MAG: malto-oligosyltrehalose synthase [Actinomycetota bacterium]|nr:malto-oligosyltrehalose synthase [Actinomycetota bacterium]
MSPGIRATYRVQLNPGFTFDDAGAVTAYLARLGISHLYCSPYLQAAAGSTHGYDVTDHSRVNEELGGAGAHERMCAALAGAGMGHVLDIVPNHMAVSDPSNAWWWDVLRHGPHSRYASYFDIDWDPPEAALHRNILVPILGDHYGRVLEAGELRLAQEDRGVVLRYHDHVLPIAPGTVPAGRSVEEVNDDHGALHEVLERQHYRVAFWRAGDRELNYRRFFDVKTLAALRIEDERVFEDTHALVLALIADGKLDGLRIDHVDGLRDPTAYLERLRERVPNAYLVVEKILEAGEELPESWPVEGTTGYDFLNVVNGLFVDPAAEKAMSDVYLDFTREPADLAEIVRAKKLFIMRDVLASDVDRLTALFVDVTEGQRRYRDYTRHELREAIRETIAAFPVYRTYLDTRTRRASPQDVAHVQEAIEEAAARRPDLDPELFEFLCDLLLMHVEPPTAAVDAFVLRFQQTTGPVMAKGVEDTVFYNFNRLVSLNEVGADLGCFGITLEAFHDHAARAQERWPLALLATSTHDTKRSEDVRARIDLLSEIPARWAESVMRWRDANDRHRSGGVPDRNAEYLLYQTLVGAWPIEAERAVAYMEKASKEAKAHTSWVDPATDYDEALAGFVRAILGDRDFLKELDEFVAPLVEPGRTNSLSQTAIKLTFPGVPDVYQGTELWDLSLVDPDNRRPVDYETRARLLDEAVAGGAGDALRRMDEGLPKLFLTQHLLALRARHPDAFGRSSSYDALWATGPRAAHVVAFVRGGRVLTVAPRLPLTLEGRPDFGQTPRPSGGEGMAQSPVFQWRDTYLALPEGEWTDVLTGVTFAGDVSLEELLAGFPVAVAVAGSSGA